MCLDKSERDFVYDPSTGMHSPNPKAVEAIAELPEEPTPVHLLDDRQRNGLAAKLSLATGLKILVKHEPDQSFNGWNSKKGLGYSIHLPYTDDWSIQLPADCCVNAADFGGDVAAAVSYELDRIAEEHWLLAFRVQQRLDKHLVVHPKLQARMDEISAEMNALRKDAR